MSRRLLAFVCALVFVDTALFAVIAPLLPFYSDEFGLSKAQAGLLVAAYPAGVIVGSLPAGRLVARFGVRAVAVVGLALLSVSSLAFGLASQPALLDITRFAQGLASAASWTAGLAWLARETPPDRSGERLGAAFSAAVAGALLGPALGAAARGVDPAIVFGLAAAVQASLIVWALREPAPSAGLPDAGWWATLRERALLPGALTILLVGLFFGAVDVLVPLRLDALGAGGATIGLAFAITALLEAAAGPTVGRIADRIGPLRPIQLSLGLGAIVTMLLPLPDSVPILVALLAISGPILGSLFVPGMKLLSDGAEGAGLDQGYAFAVANLAWATTQAGGAAGAGAIASASSDTVAYAFLAATLALFCILALTANR
ncbi:MAG: MFS transporter [Solirubrobacterales bacterium]